MKTLVITDAAQADLRNIARYTEREWGVNRKRRYLDAIRNRFMQVRKHPRIGAVRKEVGTEYRSITSGRHVIFYKDAADHIEILRVLHERMDPHRHFDVEPLPDRESESEEPA